MDRMNFNHLYYFFVVAKEGSIKGAAEKIHVSQPTISDQIKLLEGHFNCLLFERKNRRLELTKEGQQVQDYAEKIFGLANEVTHRIRNRILIPKTTLDIGITHFMSHYFLYDTLLPFFAQEEVSVNIQENERHLLLAELEKGNVDMVFTDSKQGLGQTMSSYRIGENRTFAIAHKKFSNPKQNFPDCLNSIPFFNYTKNSFLKYEIELFFAKFAVSPKIIGEADDIDLFQMVTEQGIAFSIVPEVAKNRICKNSNVIVLGELEDLQATVWGVILKNYKGLGYKLLSQKL